MEKEGGGEPSKAFLAQMKEQTDQLESKIKEMEDEKIRMEQKLKDQDVELAHKGELAKQQKDLE